MFDINAKDQDGTTLFHTLAKHNDMIMARNFLNNDYLDLNEVDNQFNTPLHKAAEYGHPSMVQMMIRYDRGLMINFKNKEGLTPLHLACQQGQVAVVKMLMDHGAQVDPATHEQKTPLHYACENNNKTIARILLSHKANINAKTFEGWTPLHYAVQGNFASLVTELFSFHPNLEVSNGRGKTPYDLALANKNDHLVDLLHQYYIHAKGYVERYEPLIQEIRKGRVTNALNLIKSDKIGLEYMDRHGWTALHWASYKGYTEVVEELILHEVRINERTREGLEDQEHLREKKAKELAELYHHDAIVRLLENRRWELKKEKFIQTATPVVSTGISALSILL